jgi:hypothetical protein
MDLTFLALLGFVALKDRVVANDRIELMVFAALKQQLMPLLG